METTIPPSSKRPAAKIFLQDLNSNNSDNVYPALSPKFSSATLSSAPTRAYYFGCGPCHPRWLQVLANPKVYTFLLCLFVVVDGAIVSGKFGLVK